MCSAQNGHSCSIFTLVKDIYRQDAPINVEHEAHLCEISANLSQAVEPQDRESARWADTERARVGLGGDEAG